MWQKWFLKWFLFYTMMCKYKSLWCFSTRRFRNFRSLLKHSQVLHGSRGPSFVCFSTGGHKNAGRLSKSDQWENPTRILDWNFFLSKDSNQKINSWFPAEQYTTVWIRISISTQFSLWGSVCFNSFKQAAEIWQGYDRALIQSKADLRKGGWEGG